MTWEDSAVALCQFQCHLLDLNVEQKYASKCLIWWHSALTARRLWVQILSAILCANWMFFLPQSKDNGCISDLKLVGSSATWQTLTWINFYQLTNQKHICIAQGQRRILPSRSLQMQHLPWRPSNHHNPEQGWRIYRRERRRGGILLCTIRVRVRCAVGVIYEFINEQCIQRRTLLHLPTWSPLDLNKPTMGRRLGVVPADAAQ